MKAKKKLDFLMAIAEMAFNNGGDITVELEDYHSSASRFPAVSEETVNRGIVLRAYHNDGSSGQEAQP